MKMFGYFCSVFCKSKAEAQKLNAPVYEGQMFAVEKKFWRKVGLISGAIGAAILAFVGVWFWYAWFGSVPHPYFSVKFDQRSYSGAALLAGDNQIVFLHGGTLARYDMKAKKEIWSDELVTKQMVDDEVNREEKAREDEYRKYGESEPPAQATDVRRMLESGFSLHGSGKNIWLAESGKLIHYDFNSGKPLQEIPLTDSFGEFIEHPDEFLVFKHTDVGAQFVTHINIATGETHTEEFHELGGVNIAQNNSSPGAKTSGGGLPISPNGTPQPMDPQKVAAEAQNLTPAARAALPALIANAQHNQAINQELRSEDASNSKVPAPAQKQRSLETFQLIPSPNGYVQFATRMVKRNLIEREAMKAPPKTSTLNGNVNMANEMQAVNEQLNDIQRTGGGDKVVEDQSTYRVTIRRPDAADLDWTGEVTGEPHLHPLKTVNVLTAGKTVMVFDKSNKLLWKTELTYEIPNSGDDNEFFRSKTSYGEGPCAEHGDTLYVFDKAVLTAFDLNSGNARWRLPSVGIVGLLFDDEGKVYVNTTSASPDDIKYAKQIDVTKKTDAILLKIDPATGKIIWGCNPGGFVSYLSGKYIYTYSAYDRSDDGGGVDTGIHLPSYLRIARINPKNGKTMWTEEQESAPIDVQFDANTIVLIFKKEVQVLRYLTF